MKTSTICFLPYMEFRVGERHKSKRGIIRNVEGEKEEGG
jgi:hypothetical protein